MYDGYDDFCVFEGSEQLPREVIKRARTYMSLMNFSINTN
jgi:hypothetical protein